MILDLISQFEDELHRTDGLLVFSIEKIVELSDIFLAETFFKSIFYHEAIMAHFWLNGEKCSKQRDLHFSTFSQKRAIWASW